MDRLSRDSNTFLSVNMAGMSKLASKLSSRNTAVFAFGVAAVWLTARQFSSIQKHRYKARWWALMCQQCRHLFYTIVN